MRKSKITPILKSMFVDRRLQALLFFCFFIFSVLTFRLWTIQIYHQEEYVEKSKLNYVRDLPIKSKRGQILDRNGQVLAHDIDFYNVWIPVKTNRKGERLISPEVEKSLNILAKILDVPYETLSKRYLKQKRDINRKFNQICIAERIPWDKYVAVVSLSSTEFPKEAMVFTESVPLRHYPYGPAAAHIMGHMSEISLAELSMPKYASYKSGDRIGKDGLEYTYENYLRGKEGNQQVYVDTNEIQRGNPVNKTPPVPGNDLYLNVDINLQMAAEQVLGTTRGVIIISDPRDNSILAMASSPRFDPNNFSEDYNNLKNDPSFPMLHRAIASSYPPGSIFKIYEALGIMEGMKYSDKHSEFCPGFFSMAGAAHTWKCHKLTGHGQVNLVDAIRLSCDVFFYKMGLQLGINGLYDTAVQFNLDRLTGIDLKGESIRPYPSLYTWRKDWYPGDTVNAAIGQGKVSLTPLQIQTGLCAVANRGTVYTPHIANRIVSSTGELVLPIEPKVANVIKASTQTWDAIHKGMWAVVNSLGTGRRAQDKQIAISGKTGTAEVFEKTPHAWFVCFAPSEKPEIAITILLENAGHGGEVASPLAKKILEVYWGRVRLEDLV